MNCAENRPVTDTPLESITLNPERPAYIPPHMRNRPQAAAISPPQAFSNPAAPLAYEPIPEVNGANGYHPQAGLPTPAPTPAPARGAYVPPTARLGGATAAHALDDGGWGAPRKPVSDARSYGGPTSAPPGYGIWKNGHVIGQRNQRLEKELYGEVDDGMHQVRRAFSEGDLSLSVTGYWNQFRQVRRHPR